MTTDAGRKALSTVHPDDLPVPCPVCQGEGATEVLRGDYATDSLCRACDADGVVPLAVADILSANRPWNCSPCYRCGRHLLSAGDRIGRTHDGRTLCRACLDDPTLDASDVVGVVANPYQQQKGCHHV